MLVVLTGQYGSVFREPAQAALGNAHSVNLWMPSDGSQKMVELASNASVIVASAEWLFHDNQTLVRRTLQAARRLKLLLAPFSGMDWLDPEWLSAGCVVCNTNAGVDAIAEFAMLAMLEMSVHLREMDRDLREGRWHRGGSIVLGQKHRELQRRTLGLVGYGRIAHRVAELAAAFRMRVIAVSRNPKKEDAIDWWSDMSALDRLLEESDFVLVTVPGGPATAGLIGEKQFSLMKRDAVLINVARGTVVDQRALYAALLERRIGGAVIDTWYRYPAPGETGAPAELPFGDLDNILMSPHAAGWTEEQEVRRIAAVTENLARFATDRPLIDVFLST